MKRNKNHEPPSPTLPDPSVPVGGCSGPSHSGQWLPPICFQHGDVSGSWDSVHKTPERHFARPIRNTQKACPASLEYPLTDVLPLRMARGLMQGQAGRSQGPGVPAQASVDCGWTQHPCPSRLPFLTQLITQLVVLAVGFRVLLCAGTLGKYFGILAERRSAGET